MLQSPICSSHENACEPEALLLGLDIGSTTVKAVVVDPTTHEVLYTSYERHHAHQAACAASALRAVAREMPGRRFLLAVTGSGSAPIAEACGAPFVQEVVAGANAVQTLYPQARTVIELGGQDAKMIFFKTDPYHGTSRVDDMRMNGTCAGGTGAFIDEIASVLGVATEQFESLASRGTTVYEISGRCGVFAKTDIQPLLNQGVAKEDIALSTFHALVKQTVGGLAQGLDIDPPVVFQGGPLTFNRTLVRVFAERLGLDPDQVIIPEHSETIVARGAALWLARSGNEKDAGLPRELEEVAASLDGMAEHPLRHHAAVPPFFSSDEERRAFEERCALKPIEPPRLIGGDVLPVYMGIDAGSTTTKLVLLDESGTPIDSFYASNQGEPIDVAREAINELRDRYAERGVTLEVRALGTTGYGEQMFARAFGADYHTVETVAHARAALAYCPDATFILDIGGQDMKAMWVDRGVITDVIVNEACSSGCGSFLENFARSLKIPVKGIASTAFSSTSPAALGSRCTVFMTSSVISEQRDGKTPADIMAGLCRSIIENVFTKVVRVPNMDALGEHIVVQGGTFANDAVLRAFEQYVGREVTRSPYPGLMGAIGAALLAKEQLEGARGDAAEEPVSSFIGFDAVRDLTFTREGNVTCPFCGNHCNRTIISFSTGDRYVTGNRCSRGEVIGDPHDHAVRERAKQAAAAISNVPNLFEERTRLLFAKRDHKQILPDNGIRIGIPRVLAIWDSAPFWTALLESLGFTVVLSAMSSHKMYERGLSAVSSDTICFPAKLVHGHIRDLADKHVNRIFMPIITTVAPEGTAETAESMCAVVKGYPMVIRSSDNPAKRFDIPFDSPLFHWYTAEDREHQLVQYLASTFNIPADATHEALAEADRTQAAFSDELEARGAEVLKQVQERGGTCVVLAARPYQTDPLVNHNLPGMFIEQGVPVLTADSVPGMREVDLTRSRLDIANNYHARILSCALIAARTDCLEFAQIASFGCGHDAYLADEAARLMHEVSAKRPLLLKVDESAAEGALRIRVRSFLETTRIRRARGDADMDEVRELPDPYPVKFTREERDTYTVLVPNTSHAFSRLMAAAFAKQGLKTASLDLGRENAIRLGKRYVHNDICFPAQIVIGEVLDALMSGRYDLDHTAVMMAKYVGDCRLTHYSALLRKALDDAGFAQIPIVTNDTADDHNLHPGIKMSPATALRIAHGLPMIDALEELLRKMRPYEKEPGASDRAFEIALDHVMEGIKRRGVRGGLAGFRRGIQVMSEVEIDRSHPRPTVLIVGEYLLNFHPGANRDIELYLERNGFEVIEARMTDVIRKTYFYKHAQVREYGIHKPFAQKAEWALSDDVFEFAQSAADRIACKHPLYEPPERMPELVRASDDIVHHTFDAGEGVLIPAEILHHAQQGCRAFIILQPFGCLPNHIVGRGIVKSLKERYPDVSILPLDYDPDTSQANIENRLQMLIMEARAQG
ncbi:acyl-CoA dehydratase activase [Collinsella ihumii]|uniref:acyl-CoA dehydratase activase n=1 Tax=Collinsella ihumii TaxID=1720204 RepID=UPI0025AA6E89|nr:acyl-CoA dehydratase activase [Collinsella ihumii]MDN0054796.1 acyl-CoA dehydratase activase [Collinsella ihumii]